MNNSIISVNNLSKSYLVGHNSAKAERYTALRDVLARNLKSFGRKTWDMLLGKQIIQGDEVEEFWALNDVSFEVKQGDVVGIIGRNGAGKSTLLKILSRITEPTRGNVRLRGRVASLLEVGTGFHPELSGRENIFLNGAILGMGRSEIRRKFDEIVDFAEIEQFLDTPVKRYSSGMYVRLAFSVAAHLDPEILIIDEVLAVGDVNFQRKCLGKVKEVVANQQRTVLFVSHNLPMITGICDKAVLLDRGRVTFLGDPSHAVMAFQDGERDPSLANMSFTESDSPGDEFFQLKEVEIRSGGNPSSKIFVHEPMDIVVRLKCVGQQKTKYVPYPQLTFATPSGEIVFITAPNNHYVRIFTHGEYVCECRIPPYTLNSGSYLLSVGMATCDREVIVHFNKESVLIINVTEDLEREIEHTRNGYAGEISGYFRPQFNWNIFQSVKGSA